MNIADTITEQDIFNFVFFPEKVSAEIRRAISDDVQFSSIIKFYGSLKVNVQLHVDNEQRELLASKIGAYKKNIFRLAKREITFKENHIQDSLAADSAEVKPVVFAEVFSDTYGKYLLRVVSGKETLTVYVFSTLTTVAAPIKVTILPRNVSYDMECPSKLQLPRDEVIEGFIIEEL